MPSPAARLIIFIFVALFIAGSAGLSSAGVVWTDFDGDGLPDPATPFSAPAGSTVSVDVWIDAQSFNWTNYLAFVEWTPGALSFESATYAISGGVNFPLNRFDQPNAVGFGGTGYDEGGIDLIGSVTLLVNETVAACVAPIIDINDPYYVFCMLGNGPSYFLFESNPGSCFGDDKGGACCLPTGACIITSPDSCASDGGQYQGGGTSCEDANCPQLPVEACCLPSGGCADRTPAQCVNQQGVPQGPGTSCATDSCPDPLPPEACCFDDCVCLFRSPGSCIALGGTPQGPGTTCGNTPCGDCPTQSCCFPDGTCQDLLVDECEAAGGIPLGANTLCAMGLCVPGTACCFPDLSCQELTPAACEAAGGNSFGYDLPCSGIDCSQTTSACCFPSGECVLAAPSICATVGGISFPNQDCAEVQCVPTSVEPTTWGKLKGLFR